ncbi:hypothetical protein RUM44_012190 [Polyplax serrata]|uniref:Uncharacterized protein n=1 Tax=Polyplax serrata TaxID=468196 RepID=A0ABR1BCQ9_POLSC
MSALKVVSHWLPGRGGRVQGDGQDVPDGYPPDYEEFKHLGRISRSADGRFVVESARNSLASRSSSSDDGGFLARRTGLRLRAFDRASWRRPLVAYPSELSLRSDGTGQSNFGERNILRYLREKSPSPFFKVSGSPLTTPTSSVLTYGRKKGYAHSSASSMTRRFLPKSPSQSSQSPYLQRLPQIPVIYSNRNHPANYGVIVSTSLVRPSIPSTMPRLIASSPTNSNSITPIWSPSSNFSDLSSVPVPSSAERSFPSTISQNRPSYIQLRNVHEKYAQELPSLRAIHEETSRLPQDAAFFLPVQPSPPRIRIPASWNDYRAKSRLPPRHARQAQSAPELTRPNDEPVNSTGLLMETSPESRSSSSGFGSKNTFSQQNQSSQSTAGSNTEWRVTTYKTPGKAVGQTRVPLPQQYTPQFSPPIISELQVPYLITEWFDLTPDVQGASPASDLTKVDASVDGHYEFDTAFPASPTPPIPVSLSYPRQTLSGETVMQYPTGFYTAVTPTGSTRPKRPTKYDNIEARVQAMKEEYYAFRRRQEKRKYCDKLESVC